MSKRQLYKEHRIRALTRRLPDSNRWTAHVVINWSEGTHERMSQFDIKRGFATEEDASRAALDFGEQWIDDGKPKLR